MTELFRGCKHVRISVFRSTTLFWNSEPMWIFWHLANVFFRECREEWRLCSPKLCWPAWLSLAWCGPCQESLRQPEGLEREGEEPLEQPLYWWKSWMWVLKENQAHRVKACLLWVLGCCLETRVHGRVSVLCFCGAALGPTFFAQLVDFCPGPFVFMGHWPLGRNRNLDAEQLSVGQSSV